MKKILLLTTILTALVAGSAAAQANLTVAATGIYPPATLFNAVPISGLQSGYGIEIATDGSAVGQFCTVLLGVNALGLQQKIAIVGTVSSGSKTAANAATFTGTCSVDMADGTPPTVGVPFTAAITTDANDQGTLALTIGINTLPNAVVNAGSMTIK